jgi:non-specific serine/threonine protein kinase
MLETLGQYKILDRIGAGGMGEVYRARDTRLGRTVAIKVLPAGVADDPDRRGRFMQEARATAALSHPNIAALYEIGEDQGHIFLVFEFVPGDTLKTAIAGHPLNVRRAIDLAVQIADALAEAHAEGIVHRDIKPGNIIVTPKGAAKILDFGLATWTAGGVEREAAATMLATSAGTTLGTLAYMSPEQALGEKVDERTDIFSLGIVLFEMLTGRLPFIGSTPTALALQIVQAQPPVPSALNPSLPRELDGVVAKALAKSLELRYESAATLGAELRSIAAILDVRTETTEAIRVAPAGRGRPGTGAWLMTAIVLASLGVAAWQRAPIARAWHRAFGPSPAPVIAVMPLELADADATQRFFADGLTEDLITRIGQTPGLKVLGRSATRAYRNRSPQDVAKELGAAVVLTGSVRAQAEQVRVTLELIDPDDNTQIWADQYTRDVKDIFAVQAQVAEEVARALRVRLQPTAASARTASRLVDQRAYELYLHGRQATAERRIPEAIKLYEQAIAADDGLAEAFAGLAEALQLEMVFLGDPEDAARHQRRIEAASRAYQLDPDLPQANLAMGLAADALADALGYMRRAIEIDPSFTEAYHQIGDQIEDFDPDLAIRFYRRSLQLDPRMDVSRLDLSFVMLTQNRWDDARRELDGGSASSSFLQGWRILIDVDERRFQPAAEATRTLLPALRASPTHWLPYVVALRDAGHRDDALREATQMIGKFPDFCFGRAVLAGLRREHGQASAAHQLADSLLRAASSETGTPMDVRCGATAAAAMGDAPALAAILDRIASKETLLRYWALGIFGQSGRSVMRGRAYPWVEIIDTPAVRAARQHLDAAYDRERAVAQDKLAGVLDR